MYFQVVGGFGHVLDGFTAVNQPIESSESLSAKRRVLMSSASFLCGIVFLNLYHRVCSIQLIFPGANPSLQMAISL